MVLATIFLNKYYLSKEQKQFGVWMDSHHATVAGRENADAADFTVIGHSENTGAEFNTRKKCIQ